ncbi:beta-galactosidase trimerization domain-containing protein [Paenibacillus sp. GCM10012306]|uniref:beta-galactosidase trimerization domain-containing protein n=1 Tax=Paenibacillus sp. GCM10012306 TaxID=3317342 RepID=UPI00360B6F19
MSNWINTTFRKLHLDYHQPEWMKAVAGGFTEEEARRQAAMFKEAGIQAVEFFAYDHYGHTFYPSDIAPTHPGLRNDYTGLMSRALKDAGIRPILYLNAFTSVHLQKDHPEWLRVLEDGTLTRGAWLQHEASQACISSGFLDEYYLPLLKEAVARHEPDAVWIDGGSWTVEYPCYCESCRKLFLEDTGRELPQGSMPEPGEELNSPEWLQWRLWRRGQIFHYVRKLVAAVKEVSPETLVAENNLGKYFYGLPLMEGGKFVRWLTPKELGLDWLSCDPVHFGANHEMIFSKEGRYQATTGLTFDYMNERFHGWGEWQIRPTTDWKLEMATILAVGARGFFADQPYPDGRLEPAVYRELGAVHEFMQEREPYATGTHIVPEVAVLASLPSQLLGPVAGAEWGRDKYWGALPKSRMDRVDGASQFLVEMGIQHLIYDEATLREQLDRQALVIVPDQCLMEEATITALETYVENGGRLIVTGRSGLWDEQGRRRQGDLFAGLLGLKRSAELPAPLHYWQAGDELAGKLAFGQIRLQAWGTALQAELEGAETLAELLEPVEEVWADSRKRREDWRHYTTVGAAPAGNQVAAPAVTLHSYGQGSVMYLNGDLFALYYLEGHRLIREWLDVCIEDIYPKATRMIQVQKPLHVEMVLNARRTDSGEELLVHFLNYFAQKRPGYVIHNEEIVPVQGISFQVAVPTKPTRVLLQPENTELAWKWDGSRAIIELPVLELHAIVQIIL